MTWVFVSLIHGLTKEVLPRWCPEAFQGPVNIWYVENLAAFALWQTIQC